MVRIWQERKEIVPGLQGLVERALVIPAIFFNDPLKG
jgi:hypothetical protein